MILSKIQNINFFPFSIDIPILEIFGRVNLKQFLRVSFFLPFYLFLFGVFISLLFLQKIQEKS